MSNFELRIALQNIENEYYRDSSNFDDYTLEEYIEFKLDEYIGA